MLVYTIDNRTTPPLHEALLGAMQQADQVNIMVKELSLYGFDVLCPLLEKPNVRLILSQDLFTSFQSPLLGGHEENKLKNALKQKALAKQFWLWLNKIEFKLVDSRFIAQNIIHITHKDGSQFAVFGSSTLTAPSMGKVFSEKSELNTATTDPNLAQAYRSQFDMLWQQTPIDETLTTIVSDYLLEVSQHQSAEFIYFLTLHRLFTDLLKDLDEDSIVNSKTGFKNTSVWQKLYPFQKDGVLGVIDKLEKFGGCILADSVGLGKTFEALAVIKYYELRNHRVLVLAPKKLRENWTLYTLNDRRNVLAQDRFAYSVLNHTDLTRETGYSGDLNLETINWSNYDLVVIDESHNFRNASTAKDKHTRYSKLMNDILCAGVKTKVLMLSATPVNNRLNDLKNQIAFVTEGNDMGLAHEGIANISQTLKKAQSRFNEWLKLPDSIRTTDMLLSKLNFDYFKLLDLLTIARSRKHIEKYYKMDEIGKFPQRLKPINIQADFDTQAQFPSLKEINRIIGRLNLSSFSPLKYVELHKRKHYEQKYDTKLNDGNSVFSQLDREKSLIGLIKINMLKRLESSVFSFRLTVQRLLSEVEHQIKLLEQHQLTDIEEMNILETDIDSAELEGLLVGRKVKVLIADMDQTQWMFHLTEDRDYLRQLLNASQQVSELRDQKLVLLKERIAKKIQHPLNEGNKKVIIFTAFADTAQYLFDALSGWAQTAFGLHTGLVIGTGANKSTNKLVKAEFNEILTAFSPRSKERNKLGMSDMAELDLLIATDCISEGQNLQDCDYLINYDIHWNPVRIIQRFGRVDRLGSTNNKIQLVNFWPNIELDEYIDLEARVSGRMVLLDVSATGEENIIDENDAGRMRDLDYRRKQLEQLQDSVIDLEDMTGGLSITDLTLNDFKMDLTSYLQEHKTQLENSAHGLYSVVPLDHHLKNAGLKSGVMFCLKSLDQEAKASVEDAYALYPYFLVYVSEDEQIIYPYTQAKKVMDLLKKHGLGQTLPQEDWFKQAGDSTHYVNALQSAINHILGRVEDAGVKSLFSRGGTRLAKLQVADNFEVISYLVLLDQSDD
jgi:ERCC4-related helicase